MAEVVLRNLRDELREVIIPALQETGVSLGRGAYGEVVKMKMNERDVAVKKVHRVFIGAQGWEENLQKFGEECKRLKSLNHPNIVTFLGIYYEANSNVPMLVMEFLPLSLRCYVEENDLLPEDKRTSILLDIAKGLEHMHGQDPPIIHRDLTSNNILLTSDLRAKIADLGVSKLLNRETLQRMTNVPGTDSHMPPEARIADQQAYMQDTDKAKKLDVFSFGNVMINVLIRDFPDATPEHDGRGRRKTEYQRRQHLMDKIPCESREKELIICCLNNNPENRPTASELAKFFHGREDEDGYKNHVLDEEEVSFVEPPGYDVKCPICFEILEDAYQATCCGNHICGQCNRVNKCPFCRNNQFSAMPDKFFSRQLMSMQVECYNSKRGCPWTGELRALKEHIENTCEKNFAKCKYCSFRCSHKALPEHTQVCPEAPKPCPNRCPFRDIRRKDLKRHLEGECILRAITTGPIPQTANNCVLTAPLAVTMTKFPEHARTGNAWYSPPFYTHEGGYKVQLRVDANWYRKGYVSVLVGVLKGEHDHKLTWPLYAKVEVALYNWKTNEPLYAKILHLPGDAFCLRNMTDRCASWGKGIVEFVSIESLAQNPAKTTEYLQHNCLNFQINEFTLSNAPQIPQVPAWAAGNTCFVVPSFSSMKKNDLIFYGSPFYTHRGGYKLCPRVDPNGFGPGKGTHLSVSCTVMKGENDDRLPWPISADVVIQMLNWREDKNHKSHTVSFNKGTVVKAVSKVPIEGIAEMCYGLSQFAVHSSLPYNSKTQYLNRDCLLFKLVAFTTYSATDLATRRPAWVNQAVGYPYPCFTMPEFTKRKNFGGTYYSDPFYSHRDGYKLQLYASLANGEYVGLYVHVMKGPNDDKLQWPFHADIVLELVNWQSDKGHHRQIVSFSFKCTNTACDRVTSGDRGASWGNSSFVRHSSLPANPQAGTEFLQNDCLHFRVKEVVIHSVPTLYKIPSWQNYQSIKPSMQFTINNFTKRRSLDSEYYGPVFYTHQGGYKMRLNVAYRDNKQVAIFAALQKGENDLALDWPFHGNIIVELLNWRQNRNPHSYNIEFHERIPGQYSSRVEAGPSGSYWGTSNFISYNSLPFNQATNTEYIQGDCLCIKVSRIATYSARLAQSKTPRWQTRDTAASFTVTDVAKRVDFKNHYYSPPFYVAKYKMCLSLKFGESEAGQLSMYACLLKGEHDDKLEWPFCGDVIVEVLNWHGDQGHYKKALSLTSPYLGDNHERVMSDLTEPGGYGKSKFMPLSTLMTSKFLDEGCMRIRVNSAIMYNTPLRFKTPSWQGRWIEATQSSLMEFTVTGISGHMTYGSTCYSPPFYTHRNGYKLRLEVDESKTNLAIYVRLLKGEHDNSLMWPMNVNLTVEMLNWVKNSFHISKVIRLGEGDMTVRGRVPQHKESAEGCRGYSEFCSREKLFGGPRHIQYVEEDCVRIRVKGVVIYSRKKVLGLFT